MSGDALGSAPVPASPASCVGGAPFDGVREAGREAVEEAAPRLEVVEEAEELPLRRAEEIVVSSIAVECDMSPTLTVLAALASGTHTDAAPTGCVSCSPLALDGGGKIGVAIGMS